MKIKGKNYFTVEELVAKGYERALADPRWHDAVKRAMLMGEFKMCPHPFTNKRKILSCAFDPIGQVMFGTNEGIIATVSLAGTTEEFVKQQDKEIFLIKSYNTDEETFLALGTCANIICYHIRQIANENMERFD